MSEHAITRRSLLRGMTGALALAGCAHGLSAWNAAIAEGIGQKVSSVSASICAACPARCGMSAYTVDGTLDKVIGSAVNPSSHGKLCARGYAYTQVAYAPERLGAPLKRDASGGFQEVSWEEALAGIGSALGEGAARDPASMAVIHDGGATSAYYLGRLANALGSANVFVDGTMVSPAASGISVVTGAPGYRMDLLNARKVLLVGTGYAEGATPAVIADLATAREAGADITYASSVADGASGLAATWLPVKPGSELDLLLGVANVLVADRLYDEDFIAANAKGFDGFASAIAAYTPDLAGERTGLGADAIVSLAVELALAAPAVCVDVPQLASAGQGYEGSAEVGRMAALLNGLLGSYGQKGGVTLTSLPRMGELTGPFAPIEVDGVPYGSDAYPLGPATDAAALAGIAGGKVKSLIVHGADPAMTCADAPAILGGLDLLVVVTPIMTETARLADYVLPVTTAIESDGLPEPVAGISPAVSLGIAAIDAVLPDVRSIDAIACGLAEASGVGESFGFTLDELVGAQLMAIDSALEGLEHVGTAFPGDGSVRTSGQKPVWSTASGKLEFSSAVCEAAGLGAVPGAVSRPEPDDAELRLVSGGQFTQFGTRTLGAEPLMVFSERYHLTDAWINTATADELGIANGDDVRISNCLASGITRAKVTGMVRPGCVYLPVHYGSDDFGVNPAAFAPLAQEPGYGFQMSQEAFVSIVKAGA